MYFFYLMMNLTASFTFFALLNKVFCTLSGTCDSSTVGECKADVVVSADAVIPKGLSITNYNY